MENEEILVSVKHYDELVGESVKYSCLVNWLQDNSTMSCILHDDVVGMLHTIGEDAFEEEMREENEV